MRWFMAALVALLALWITYFASPYYALYRLARAVEEGNVAELADRINIRAIRASLARAVAANLTAESSGGIASADAQLAANTMLALADPYLQALVSPAGLARLLRSGPSGGADGAPIGAKPVSLDSLGAFLAASSWRGFRNVYVLLPPGAPPPARYRLRMRFAHLKWRLVSIELPAELRRRIAEELLRSRAK